MENAGRFQIDYILVKQRFKNQLKDCKNYPGVDRSSDHNLIIGDMGCETFKEVKELSRDRAE